MTKKHIMSSNDFLIFYTIRYGGNGLFEFFVSHGIDIYRSDAQLLNEVFKQGNLDVIKCLVEKCNVDLSVQGLYALIISSRYGHIDVIKYLVSQGINIHANEEYALNVAVEYGHIDIVKYLVSQGADIRIDNDFAANDAAIFGHLEILKYLVSEGSNEIDSMTLYQAASNGYFDVVKYLVTIGMDATTHDNYAIHSAFVNGDYDTVEFLMSHGAILEPFDEMATIAFYHDDKRLLKYAISIGQFHKDINPYDYFHLLDHRHLPFIDEKYDQVIKTIKSRIKKIVNAYTDIMITTEY